MNPSHHKTIGDGAQARAEQHLRALGYRFLGRNLHAPMGEVDLLFEEGTCLVVVEVRFRKRVGGALESVDQAKENRLRGLVRWILARTQGSWHEVRVDVVALGEDGLEHLKDAIYW